MYDVVVERSGGWWALSVPELPGVFTQARTLTGADRAAREAIELMLVAKQGTVDVRLVMAAPR